MNCPKCGAGFRKIKVIDSRPAEMEIRRRRKCGSCGYRWTTYEMTAVQKAKYEKGERWIDTAVRKIKYLISTAEQEEDKRA